MYKFFGVSPLDTLAKVDYLLAVDMMREIEEELQEVRKALEEVLKALDEFEERLKVEKENKNTRKGSMVDRPRGQKILA
jgi:DNA topoisomerase IA